MTSSSSLIRSLLIYSICLPLAIYLGYLLAQPLGIEMLVPLGALFFLLLLPLLLRWHHLWLVASWNAIVVIPFLPGRPFVAMVLAWMSLIIGFCQYILNRRLKPISVPSVTKPLLLLAAIVLVTIKLTGGFGLGALGSETWGGKKYIYLLSAIVAYFAITSQAIQPRRAAWYVALFFLGPITMVIGDITPLLPSSLYYIYMIFPVSDFGARAAMDPGGGGMGVWARLSGLSLAALATLWALLARYGLSEFFRFRKVGRSLFFFGIFCISLLGGFRSSLILCLITFALLFYFEGLMRSRLLPIVVILMLLGCALLVPFVNHLPLSIQRSLSFLPLAVDPVAKESARVSSEWRLQMWSELVPQIPHYLILGKGYTVTASEMNSLRLNEPGSEGSWEGAATAGDYHNGPLSVILAFGIPGTIAFIWFLISSWRVLHRNFRYGHPIYQRLNLFLFAYFVARVICFFAVFGSLYSDLAMFTGLVGLSISLNGGVATRPALAPQTAPKPQTIPFRRPDRKPFPA